MHRFLLVSLALPLAAMALGADKPGEQSGTKSAPNLNLDGLWQGFVVVGKGEQPNRGTVHLELTIKGNSLTARRLDGQGGPLGQGSYTITSGRFYVIDATENRGRAKGRTYQGICTFGPDLMKWCVATPGNPRPTDFETKGQHFLLILKRQKPATPVNDQ